MADRRKAQEEHRTRAERVTEGKAARRRVPLGSHGEFEPAADRDPVGMLLEQAQGRVPELVPIRHGRMLPSPFTYYRGAALPMAADLAITPVSGLQVQLCGDAHLANFGAFASPERRLVFDLNDFDETLPGPFEWDVKRLTASFEVAGRINGYDRRTRRAIVVAVGRAYRAAMRTFAGQSHMDVWYARLDVDDAIASYRSQIKPKRLRLVERMMAQARAHDSRQAVGKLTTVVDGRHRIISTPPTVVPVEELLGDIESDALYELIHQVLETYRQTLQTDRRHLSEQYRLVQVARKIVGVGSVGQRAWVVLTEADGEDPLFLQAKEAQPSVLAAYCGQTKYDNQGQRVVAGQRLMQAASDIFLGWTQGLGADGVLRDYYVRQLRDWKFSFPVEAMRPEGMTVYAHLCGWTLARAHARSGDRIALAAYLGRSDAFDTAIADFADAYADQTERDHATFRKAVRSGRLEATTGV